MINKAFNRYVFIDTETGGTIPQKHSLLQIGLVIWDYNDGIIAKKQFFIKHKRYFVTKEAKKINKFNREEHNKLAQEPAVVIEELLSFLQFFHRQMNLLYIQVIYSDKNLKLLTEFVLIFQNQDMF